MSTATRDSPRERGNTVERLGELQSEVGNADGGHDRDIGVGADFKSSKTTGDDSGADDESSEDGLLVLGLVGHGSDGPEQNGTERVERESHDKGLLVSVTLHDDGLREENVTISDLENSVGAECWTYSNRRPGKVTNTEVSDLETGRLQLGDVQSVFYGKGKA